MPQRHLSINKLPLNGLVTAILSAIAANAVAEDELTVQVTRDGNPAQGLSIVLDGGNSALTGPSGLALFDLTSGQHSVQITDSGEVIHTFRFSSARDQLADIGVDLSGDATPRVTVETYELTETAAQLQAAARGSIQGVVTSSSQPVSGATVELINGITRTVTTDANGAYVIEAPRGLYDLVVSGSGMGSQEVSDFRIVANATIGADFALGSAAVSSSAGPMEEMVIIGSATVGGQQETERFAVEIVDVLDYEQLARFGDSDIAASVLRVPAVTIQDGKYVFVRGLGGRYLSTNLNGATMPSPDPAKRAVPLDLFPSSMVEQLDIGKSFVASSSGESTGGEIRIATRTFPTESIAKFSVGIGYQDDVTGDDVWTDPLKSDWDFVGVDDGARERPFIAAAVAEALAAQSQYTFDDVYDDATRAELSRIAALTIKDGFDPGIETASPNLSFNFSYGDLLAVDQMDADFGYFVAASLKNEWNREEGFKARYQPVVGGLGLLEQFDFTEYENTVDFNGLVALGFNRGLSSYESNTIINRSTLSSVERSVGFDNETGNLPAVSNLIEYEERQYVSQQFAGSHVMGAQDQWTVDWQGTASRADRYAPDRRQASFRREDGADQPYAVLYPSLTRRYDELVDENLDLAADIEYIFMNSANQSTLSFGANAISRERDSDSQTFGFDSTFATAQPLRASPNLDVNDAVNSDTITGDRSTGFGFADKTQRTDSYEAEMTLNSFYVSYDTVLNYRYQFVVGVRYEDYEQITDTFDFSDNPVRSVLEESSALPAFTFNWLSQGDQQIRFSATQTVARPDFKETSAATFFDRDLNLRVEGNPNLKLSDITNYDIRWEKYWSGAESVSVAYFFKDMDDPIERVAVVTSGNVQTRTFVNAPSAEISGVELDLRKEFSLDAAFTKSLFLAVNLSVLDSEVQLDDGTTRSLQGAPDYSANLIIGYDDLVRGQEFTLLFNESGDTIIDVGTEGLPDILQEPSLSVDLNYKFAFSNALTFKFSVSNLLDSDRKYTQGNLPFRTFNVGRGFSAGFDWNF